MSNVKKVFVSSSSQDRELAKQLTQKLNAHGISTSSVAETLALGMDWQQEIEQAVKSADAVVVFIDPKHEPDRYQQFEWSTALEAEWENPDKRMIPLLMRNAEPPSFLLGKLALRVRNPKKEWGKAIEELIHVLKDEQTEEGKFLQVTEAEDPEKRRERLQYIEEVAQASKE